MDRIVVREAFDTDLDAVRGLWSVLSQAQDSHRALPKAPDADERLERSFRTAVSDPNQAWFVAEREGVIVGMAFAHLERPSRMSDETVLELSRVVVAPTERDSGVAAALVAEAERLARRLGAGHLGVKVLVTNAEAASYWEHAGFEPSVLLSLRPVRD